MRSRLATLALGPPTVRPLALAHGVAAAANSFVAVSLAGSLFFSVSPDASRQQVLLYLLVTMIPLAIIGPFVGPTVDRFNRHPQPVAAAAYLLRALFAVLLAQSLFELSFYFFATGLLIAGKASGVIKQAMVPMATPESAQLVSVNAMLARVSSALGAVGAGAAGIVIATAGAPWVLRCGALLFVLSAVIIWRLRPVQRLEPVPTEIEYAETHLPTITTASIGFMAIRAAVGFFAFTMAFTLRRQSEHLWVYGATLGIYGIGAYAGDIITPILRRRFREQRLLTGAIALPAVFTLVGMLGVSRPMLLAVAAAVGLSTTLGRHSFDSLLQHRAPDALRGRSVAKFETFFSLAYIAGAVSATPITMPAEASMAVLSAIYVPTLIIFARSFRSAVRLEQEVAGQVTNVTTTTIKLARLSVADDHLRDGNPRAAVVDASAAVDFAQLADSKIGERPERVELEALRHAALGADDLSLEDAERAIELARVLLAVTSEAAAAPPPG